VSSDAVTPLLQALREFYGRQPVPPADLFQFIVWEIVSERALAARRDRAWLALRNLPALTPDAMFRAKPQDLVAAVGLAGPRAEDKLERMRAAMHEMRRHRDRFERGTSSSASLLTAARVVRRLTMVDGQVSARALLFVAGFAALPLDDDAARVVVRLDSPAPAVVGPPGRRSAALRRQRRAARRWLRARLPHDADAYREAVVYLRHHGQHTCLAAGPRCGICPLRLQCPSGAAR
jgi:endonuclease III